jgi:hypothetical protein
MSDLKIYQCKKLARLEADGVQVKRERKCFEAIHSDGCLEPTSEDEEDSAGACSFVSTPRARLPPPRVLTRRCLPVCGCCARRR